MSICLRLSVSWETRIEIFMCYFGDRLIMLMDLMNFSIEFFLTFCNIDRCYFSETLNENVFVGRKLWNLFKVTFTKTFS